jgi:hypothetical protein
LARHDLDGAQAVLIEVVGVDALDAQGGIAVASASATEVELVVDATYPLTS